LLFELLLCSGPILLSITQPCRLPMCAATFVFREPLRYLLVVASSSGELAPQQEFVSHAQERFLQPAAVRSSFSQLIEQRFLSGIVLFAARDLGLQIKTLCFNVGLCSTQVGSGEHLFGLVVTARFLEYVR